MTESSNSPTTYARSRAAAPALNGLFTRTEMVPASVLRVLLWVLVVVALVDPADQIFHLKVPVFALIVVLWMIRAWMRRNLDRSVMLGVLAVGIVVPTLWTLLGLLWHTSPDNEIAFAALKTFLFLFLLPVIVTEDLDLSPILNKVSFVIGGLTIGFATIFFIWPATFQIIYPITLSKEVALLNSGRDQFGIGVGAFYYKTAPVMVLAFAEYGRRLFFEGKHRLRNGLCALFFLVAVVASGSRANVIGTAFVLGMLTVTKVARRWGRTSAFALAMLGVLSAAVLFSGFFDPTETGNETKIGHYRSYIEEFRQHPEYLIIGQGAETSFFSEGFRRYTSVTELTYIELIRQFGVPMTALLLLGLLWPVYKLISRRVTPSSRWLAFGCIAYYFISGSNPLLLSSTGLLVVLALWQRAIVERPEPRQRSAVA